jgi:hypothetical protein
MEFLVAIALIYGAMALMILGVLGEMDAEAERKKLARQAAEAMAAPSPSADDADEPQASSSEPEPHPEPQAVEPGQVIKAAICRVSLDCLSALMKLPQGTVIDAARYDAINGNIEIRVLSPALRAVPRDERLPLVEIMVTEKVAKECTFAGFSYGD